MDNIIDLANAFKIDAGELRQARARSKIAHPSDLRAAGEEVERTVREYFRRALSQRYYVTSGHLIDADHRVSPQIDVIIADAFSLPSLYTVKDGTEYVPITSVYAIGEIKSTYYKSKKYFHEMSDSLAKIATMHRPLIENTAFQNVIQDNTTFRDMMLGSNNRFLNRLFSFLFCVDSGDFAFEDVNSHLNSVDPSLVPNVTVLLDKGTIMRMRVNKTGEGIYHKYPTEASPPEYDWVFAESMDSASGSKEGSSLALLYGMLIDHLSNSHLEPANAYPYTAKLVNLRRSTLLWANGRPPHPSQ